LIAGESTRLLDAVSTEQFMHNPCHCFHEAGSPQVIAAHAPLQYAYSHGVAAGYTMLSDIIRAEIPIKDRRRVVSG
jgi:hypothetical protein